MPSRYHISSFDVLVLCLVQKWHKFDTAHPPTRQRQGQVSGHFWGAIGDDLNLVIGSSKYDCQMLGVFNRVLLIMLSDLKY